MPKLKAHNPQRAKLKASGYMGEPTGEIELTENHRAYNVKVYAIANVNVPDPVLVEKTITANGTYQASADEADGYSDVTVALPFEQKEVTPSTAQQDVTVTPNTQYQALSKVTVLPAPLEAKTVPATTEQVTYTPEAPAIGFSSVTVEGYVPPAPPVEKDVNFYDYDGTLLYSYTFAEASQLSALPEPPVHEGLTDASWSYTLLQLQQSVQSRYPCAVYAEYNMLNDISVFDINIIDGSSLTVPFNFSITTGNITIDWGDGTTEQTNIATSHTYIAPASYSITITNNGNGIIKWGHGFDGGGQILGGSAVNRTLLTRASIGQGEIQNFAFSKYKNLHEVFLSKNVPTVGKGAFYFANLYQLIFPSSVNTVQEQTFYSNYSLEYVAFSPSISVIERQIFYNCLGLRKLIIPKGVPTIASMLCYSCQSLTCVSIPNSVANIVNRAFQGTSALSNIFIPNSVATIEGFAFYQSNLQVVDLSDYTNPSDTPTLNDVNAFPDSVIFLAANQEMLTAFSSATNWSTYADRFQIKGGA